MIYSFKLIFNMSLTRTDQEENEFMPNIQNTNKSTLNKYIFKTGILHEKLNISKPAVISYDDFMDLLSPFTQNPISDKDEFDKEVSQFVQEWEQNRNINNCDLKTSITNNEVVLETTPPLPETNSLTSNGSIEPKASTTINIDILECETRNETIDTSTENDRKIITDTHNDIQFLQEECFENVVTCENNNNISIFCKKNKKKQIYKCNNQEDINLKIYVIDYINNLKKEFVCSKNLLTEKMKIFSEINNNKSYSFEDIVVHCDLNTFGWLIHWMKEGTDHTKPVISFYNVIPILIAANVFKINLLVEQCIIFIRLYINNVIEATEDFSKVSNQLITKLTHQFSNTDVENIVDKNDKLQPALYCNLILFLANQKPNKYIKHFSSLTNIFCCKFCGKVLPKDSYSNVLCKTDYNIVNLEGQVKGLHVRDKTWSLTSYVKTAYEKLKNWRLVYWQLWGTCHFLFCSVCHMLYPLCQASWCPYHPGEIEYFKLDDEGNIITLPIGRYDCCGQRAYKYECIKNPNCCSHKSHIPVLKTPSEIEINHLYLKHQNLISVQPPQKNFPGSVIQLIRSHNKYEDAAVETQTTHCWSYGIQLIPRNYKHPCPLVPKFWEETYISNFNKSKSEKVETKGNSYINNLMTYVSFSEVTPSQLFKDSLSKINAKKNIDEINFVYSNLKEVPDELSLNTSKVKVSRASMKKKKKHKNESDELLIYSPHALITWNTEENVKFNQDNQRDYEDWAFSRIISHLTKINHIAEPRTTIQPSGGSYFRIEADWQEKHKKLFIRKFDKKVMNLKRGSSFTIGNRFW